MNIFKSRSTITCILSFATICLINVLALKAGFFNTEFALVSIYLCKDLLIALLGHQLKADELESTTSTSVTSPAASVTSSTTTTETKAP